MKKNLASQLNVVERLRSTLQLFRHENPTGTLSISELCRRANVNRAGLYAHHGGLLDEIRAMEPPAILQPPRTSANIAEVKTARPVLETKALLYLCLELQLEVRSLRALLPTKRPRRGRNS